MAKAMAMTNTSSKQLQMWHIFLAALAALLILGNFGCGGGGGGNGDDPIVPVVCKPPFVPSSSGTVCVCPAGTHDENLTCVPNSTTDTTPPTVSVTNPANNATVSGNLTVTANVTDDHGIAEVNLTVDGSQTSNSFAENTAHVFTTIVNTQYLTNGSHTIKVCAIDTSANTSCSGEIVMVVYNATTANLVAPTEIWYTTRPNATYPTMRDLIVNWTSLSTGDTGWEVEYGYYSQAQGWHPLTKDDYVYPTGYTKPPYSTSILSQVAVGSSFYTHFRIREFSGTTYGPWSRLVGPITIY